MKTNTMRTWLAAGVLGMAVVCAPHVAVAAEYWFDLNGATLNFGDPGSGDWSGTASNWNPGPVAVGTNQTVVWPNKAWPATPDNINFRNRNSTHFGTLANPNWLITVVGTQTIGRIKLDNTSVSRPMYIVLTNGVVSFQDATAKDVAASSNITLHVCSDMKFDATSTNPLSTEYSYQFYAGALSSFTPNNQLILGRFRVCGGISH